MLKPGPQKITLMLNNYLPFHYPVIAFFFCSLPYIIQGYPLGHDAIHGLIRVKEYQLALANYQLPPYWADNLYGGYGSPVFLFYAPLYMLVATIFYLLTGSITSGSIWAMSFFTVVGALGIYRLVQEMLGEKTAVNECAARIASYFFILNPYLIGDKFTRNANSEYTALCLAPLCLYGLARIKRDPLKGSLILAAGLALAILAHNLTALTITAMLITLSPILYWDNTRKQIWLFILGGIILGLLLSSFFWLPALYYKSLTHTERLTQGFYDFHNNFQALSKFFTTSDFFSMGLLNLWIIIKSASLLWAERTEKKTATLTLAKTYLIFALLFIFLQTKLSLALWENISYLALFQFPWRMMGPLALAISILAGLLFPLYYKSHNYKSFKKLELTLLCLCIINILPHLVVSQPLSESLINKLTSLFETNNIKTIIFTSTEADEYLPKSAKIKLEHYANEYSQLILGTTSKSSTTIIKESGTEIILETDSSQPTQLELKRWFFPGWKSTINGLVHPVNMSENGLLSLQIPTGQNRILLKLQPPLLRQIVVWISLGALIIWIMLMIKAYYSGKSHPHADNQKQAI